MPSSAVVTNYFWKRHFGTDYQWGSWFFIFSTVPYVAVLAVEYESAVDAGGTELTQIAWLLPLIGAIMYLIGSFLFLYLSYPENWQQIMKDTVEIDVEKLSYVERYVTFNWLLIATWLFFLPGFFFYAYPASCYIQDTCGTAEFAVFIVFITILILITWLWVYASFPDNIRKNNFQGSSSFYDNLSACCCLNWCCGESAARNKFKKHLGTDFLVGSYAFCFVATGFFILCLYYVCLYPTAWIEWLLLVSAFFFATGFYIITYASYPESLAENDFQGSTYIYDFIVTNGCIKPPKSLRAPVVTEDEEDQTSNTPDESSPLLKADDKSLSKVDDRSPSRADTIVSAADRKVPDPEVGRGVTIAVTCKC